MEKRLHYDWYRRSGLIDHFFGPEGHAGGIAHHFVLSPRWAISSINPTRRYGCPPPRAPAKVRMFREGRSLTRAALCPVRVEKELTFGAAGGLRSHPLHPDPSGRRSPPVRFGVEFGFSLQAGDTFDRYYIIPGQGSAPGWEAWEKSEIFRKSRWARSGRAEITLSIDRPADFWRFPIETISNPKGGFERVYRAGCHHCPGNRASTGKTLVVRTDPHRGSIPKGGSFSVCQTGRNMGIIENRGGYPEILRSEE